MAKQAWWIDDKRHDEIDGHCYHGCPCLNDEEIECMFIESVNRELAKRNSPIRRLLRMRIDPLEGLVLVGIAFGLILLFWMVTK